ncbi:MAG TPA: nucleotide kinase domain-containing protein [Rhizomicrobium sp.]|jgi:hypothetical protein|nr:nucleotide kinase domain-containing protein [Rhizomicrobium sp.]
MTAPNYEPLWHWVREREAIRIRKDAGDAFPWTDDEILKTYRFCNVRREDDRVTVWIRKNIRERFAGHPHLWFMLCAARAINWPDTLHELIDDASLHASWPSDAEFAPQEMAAVLNARADRGEKVFTGAYVITAPATKGASKSTFVATETLGQLWASQAAFTVLFNTLPKLEYVHAVLMRYDGWGPFMAYQAVVDMRFTPLLDEAMDLKTWAAAGPGTIRGLNRIFARKLNEQITQRYALSELRMIYERVTDATGVAMDFSDVPNILCETDKYLRVKNGEGKPRALYVPGRGA